jgi:DNA-binding NtrC family response regulator
MDKFRILIVDDGDDFREAVIKRLRAPKLDIEGTTAEQKSLDMVSGQDFDVVVLDVKMPGMDGIETLRELKLKKPLVEVNVLTGHASVESGIQGMQLGAFDYVMKPVALDDLADKLRQAYERRAIQLEAAGKLSG